MRFSVIFLVFVGSVQFSHDINAYVVTTYEFGTLTKYFYQIWDSPDNNFSDGVSLFGSLFTICQKLRQSRFFQIVGKETWSHGQSSRHIYTIDADTLNMEKNQLQYTETLLRIGSKLEKLRTFKCLDLDAELKWFVSPAFSMRYSAFFFFPVPDMNSLTKREIKYRQRKSILPRLTAVIDEAAFPMVGVLSTDVKKQFLQSVHNLGNNTRDSLCDLDHIMRYRLCAIAADALVGNRKAYLNDDEEIISQTYPDQSFNLYVERLDYESFCPPITIGFSAEIHGITQITRALLSCSVEMDGRNYNFYLSRNSVAFRAVFIIQLFPNNNFTKMTQVNIFSLN